MSSAFGSCFAADDDSPEDTAGTRQQQRPPTLTDLPPDLTGLVLSRVGFGDLANLRVCSSGTRSAVDEYDRPGVGSQATDVLSKACYLAQVLWTTSPCDNFHELVCAARKAWGSQTFDIKLSVDRQPHALKRARDKLFNWWRVRHVTIAVTMRSDIFFKPPFDGSARPEDRIHLTVKMRLEWDGKSEGHTLRNQRWSVRRAAAGSENVRLMRFVDPDNNAGWTAHANTRASAYAPGSRNPHIVFALDTLGALRRACTLIDIPRHGLTNRSGACLLAEPLVRSYCCGS